VSPPILGYQGLVSSPRQLWKVHLWNFILRESELVPHSTLADREDSLHSFRVSERGLLFGLGPGHGLESV
jgi:hypothetical protein